MVHVGEEEELRGIKRCCAHLILDNLVDLNHLEDSCRVLLEINPLKSFLVDSSESLVLEVSLHRHAVSLVEYLQKTSVLKLHPASGWLT